MSSGGHLDWWDGTEAFLVTESMALKQTAKLDPTVPSVKDLRFYVNYTVYANKVLQTGNNSNPQTIELEPVYTVRSLLLSSVALPFYYAATTFAVSPFVTIGLLVNSLLISLTAVLIFCISSEVHRSKKIAFVLGLIYCTCSFVWPYNSTLWVQPLQGLLLASSTYLLILTHHYDRSFLCNYTTLSTKWRGPSLAGLGGLSLGLSVFAHPTSLIFIPAFLAYSFFSVLRHQRWSFVILLASLGLVLFLVGLTNYIRFGSFTEFGYGYFSSLAAHDGWRGLIGLLISPGAGLIFYFPLAMLIPLGAKYMYKDNKALFFLCLYILVVNWIYVGTLSFGSEPSSWSGGVAWGPRYLIPVLPFMMIILGNIFLHLKKKHILKSIVIGLCVAGFFVNLTGVLVWFQYGLMYGWNIDGLAVYPNHLDVMTWSPFYSPIVLHAKALATEYVTTIVPEQYLNTSWYWADYGNAPCRYNLYLYCNFDAIPFSVAASGIVIIAAFITARIGILSFSPLKLYIRSKRI